jgi:hypothetical protein
MLLKDMDKAGETFDALMKIKPDDAPHILTSESSLFNKKKMDEAEIALAQGAGVEECWPNRALLSWTDPDQH